MKPGDICLWMNPTGASAVEFDYAIVYEDAQQALTQLNCPPALAAQQAALLADAYPDPPPPALQQFITHMLAPRGWPLRGVFRLDPCDCRVITVADQQDAWWADPWMPPHGGEQ